jgi:hypothetical protein
MDLGDASKIHPATAMEFASVNLAIFKSPLELAQILWQTAELTSQSFVAKMEAELNPRTSSDFRLNNLVLYNINSVISFTGK